MISFYEIVEEAIRLVENDESVTLPVSGNSMLPFIVGWYDCVILKKPKELKVGNVVLAWVNGGFYVLHRIIRIDGENVTLMGDGNLRGIENCSLSDVKALATHVVNAKGNTCYLYTRWKMLAAKAWWYGRPIRRYLLGIIQRTSSIQCLNP